MQCPLHVSGLLHKGTTKHRGKGIFHATIRSQIQWKRKGKTLDHMQKNQRFSSEPWTGLGFLSCVRYLLPFWSRANNLIPLALSMTPGIRALLIFWDCCEIVYVKSIFHRRRALQKHAIPPRAEASSLLLGTGQSVVQQRALSSGPQGRQH